MSFSKGFASFLQRRTGFILLVSALFTLVGGYYTVKLYLDLRTDLEELLPTSSRSVRDLNEVTQRLKSIDNLAILVFSKNTKESKRFVDDLARNLERFSSEEIAGIEYRIDRELEFFRKRISLFMNSSDLELIRNYIRDRIRYEKDLYNPLNIFSGRDIPEPELDFRALRKKYEKRTDDFAHFPGGYFATPNQEVRAILVDVPGKTLGIGGVKRLKGKIESTIEALHPKNYAGDLEIKYTGSVEEMLEEQDSLVEDLEVSTVIVLLLVSIAMIGFFRSFWETAALVTSLLASTFWTFGIAYFAVGYLNANSAFLGSIVIGNGINFGIILLARYLEERRIGRNCARACNIAIPMTAKATFTAALAAGLSYGSLMLTSFRGFRQFGVIGLIGMSLSWIGAYTLLPALLVSIERLRSKKKNYSQGPRKAFLTPAVAKMISHWPKTIAFISFVLTLLSIVKLTQADKSLLETNLGNLRSKRSVESGAAYHTRYLNQIFQKFLTPLVILPKSRSNALQIAKDLKELKNKQGESSWIVSVQTVDDFVPEEQVKKIKILKEIQKLLQPRILERLSPEDRSKAQMMLTPESFRTFTMADLPPLVRSKFTEKDGSMGKLVLVEPPLSSAIWEGENLEKFISSLRNAADRVEPGAPLAGGMAITADLVSSISKDGPRATLLAFLSAVILVVVLFREPKITCLALLALFVGVLWFGGLIVELGGRGLKINFLNFVALPITFGIGVDYGVNIFQRYRQGQLSNKKEDISQIVRETGGAVALCSLTTVIGYSSLLMASNQGFISFGLLAILGEIACAIAALIALPAALSIRKK